ncbi:MAG: DUF86 domain-containing protein [Candidatus Melainabacteria bacterium]|jgi:uncharacterized protein with HEPN domain|nr:DUF86 domain-containing protein [Candidatus Melainabacteria bacterium]
MRHDRERVEDILTILDKIDRDFSENKYAHDETYRYGMLNYLIIIGEAAKAISEKSRDLVPDLDWKSISRFRDKVVHRYFDVEWDVILDILVDHVPTLRKEIVILRDELIYEES